MEERTRRRKALDPWWRAATGAVCGDHWHCDPRTAAHDCTKLDRSKPCPSCGANGINLVMVTDRESETLGGRRVPIGTRVEYLFHSGPYPRVRFEDGTDDLMVPSAFPRLR